MELLGSAARAAKKPRLLRVHHDRGLAEQHAIRIGSRNPNFNLSVGDPGSAG
jgi:hypothetical protein